jgi:hypothetical protein
MIGKLSRSANSAQPNVLGMPVDALVRPIIESAARAIVPPIVIAILAAGVIAGMIAGVIGLVFG